MIKIHTKVSEVLGKFDGNSRILPPCVEAGFNTGAKEEGYE
jgi:hypothetical protein